MFPDAPVELAITVRVVLESWSPIEVDVGRSHQVSRRDEATDRLVRQQAATMAFADCFILVAVIYAVAIFTVPLLGKPRHLARDEELELLEPA